MSLQASGWAFLLTGFALAVAGFLLYLSFAGLLSAPGFPHDNVAASTNLVVVGVGMGLAMSGYTILSEPKRH